uniref:DDE_5 domain-containing protein n=1 Tax=Angiostrongylus cantonensis TaxID=6313 RepID=A0A158P5U2_ANGCA
MRTKGKESGYDTSAFDHKQNLVSLMRMISAQFGSRLAGILVDARFVRHTVEQLEKFDDSSIAHVIKQNSEESSKKQRLPLHWHPRNASRTPSAKRMSHLCFCYDVPINASPSSHLNRPRPRVAWRGGERSQGNTLPCFHVPESRGSGYLDINCIGLGSIIRAAALPSWSNDGTLSMENLIATISSHYSDRKFPTRKIF